MRSVETQPTNGHGEVFKLLADAVQEHLHSAVDAETVREIANEEIKKARLPQQLQINLPDGNAVTLKDRVHRQFTDLLDLVNEGHNNMMLVGPAGTGKTTLAKSLAQALNRPFGFISLSAGVTETHLFGRVLPQTDGSWQYQPSEFVQIYENGGVFLLDEMDAADPNLMVAINASLANGVMSNPNGRKHIRHENTLILGACNTWGRGADSVYVGRNQLDGSTLDRFVLSTLRVDYDTDLERDLAHGSLDAEQADALLYWINSLREKITANRIRRIASTRLVINACKALKNGKTLDQVKARYFQDWSTDEQAKVQR